MKMKKIGLLIVLAIFSAILTLGLNSCAKFKENRDNITSAEDFAASETEAAGLFDLSDDANESGMQLATVPAGALELGERVFAIFNCQACRKKERAG